METAASVNLPAQRQTPSESCRHTGAMAQPPGRRKQQGRPRKSPLSKLALSSRTFVSLAGPLALYETELAVLSDTICFFYLALALYTA